MGRRRPSRPTAVARAVEGTVARLSGCVSVDVDLGQLDRIDGADGRRRRTSGEGAASGKHFVKHRSAVLPSACSGDMHAGVPMIVPT